jgi:NADP-dependent aldehyde dehydrogenase
MSAINPLIILPQALATRAEALAKELVASFTLGCGQFCTKPGLILACGAKVCPLHADAERGGGSGSGADHAQCPTLAHYQDGVSAFEAHPAYATAGGQ